MKNVKFTLLAVLAIIATSACSQNKSKNNMEKKNVLVVYFSATGTTRKRLSSWQKSQGQTYARLLRHNHTPVLTSTGTTRNLAVRWK